LESTNYKIEDAQNYILVRTADQASFEQELAAEEESYASDTAIFNDLIEEFNKELTACNEALTVLQGAEFAGYIADRVTAYEGDTVIATNHGSGVQVNDI